MQVIFPIIYQFFSTLQSAAIRIVIILNTILGNVGEVSTKKTEEQYQPLLIGDEHIERVFAMLRYQWVFTNYRLIIQDTQGVTGRKKEYLSIPYRSISHFAVETRKPPIQRKVA